jgi:hypothetical protein
VREAVVKKKVRIEVEAEEGTQMRGTEGEGVLGRQVPMFSATKLQ